MLSSNKGGVTNTLALFAVVIESCLYGVYATIFIPTAYLIWNHRRDWAFRNGLRLLSGAFVTLFALATTHLALALSMIFNSLVNFNSSSEYITNADGPAHTASTVVWIVMIVIADTIVIWRCWILWNRKIWVLILFGVLETIYLVGSMYSLLSFSHIGFASGSFIRTIMAWNLFLNFLSLLINLLISTLICIKFYQAGRRMQRIQRIARHAQATRYYSLLLSYIESGSIYPTVMIVGLATYISGTSYVWVAINIAPQVLGIMPTLMFLVVLLKKESLFQAQGTGSTSQSLSMPSWVLRTSIPQAVDQSYPHVVDGTEPGIEADPTREEFKLVDLTAPASVHVSDTR